MEPVVDPAENERAAQALISRPDVEVPITHLTLAAVDQMVRDIADDRPGIHNEAALEEAVGIAKVLHDIELTLCQTDGRPMPGNPVTATIAVLEEMVPVLEARGNHTAAGYWRESVRIMKEERSMRSYLARTTAFQRLYSEKTDPLQDPPEA